MTDSPWTIDSIAHALPHPELRAAFTREVTFTDVTQLPAILERWQRTVEALAAEQPRVEDLREYALRHDGALPSDHRETPESRARFDDWEARMRQLREGHNAA
ncbi:hypothetical protein SRB5_53610 [Streptomyces sp. RB5]|uniref:Uncharacterized protein n=1 Tax=Streptomyces smaragdinus TaxID=2585196 RepID=A0A7K0CPE6_9ACTN|nr:hypothetical protein [Streptomyces smaragdinus]MQY15183.1 hypothetical protein [Streptomyces smaragdinus]